MQTLAVVIVAVIAAAGTATAVSWFANKPVAAQEIGSLPDAALESRIAGVETKLGDLVQRLERVSGDLATSAGRSAAAPLTAADLEAAVAKVLATQGVHSKADGANKTGPTLTKSQAIARLTEIGGSYDKLQELWPLIEKAGLEDEILAHQAALAESAPTDPTAQYQYGAMLIAGIQTKPPAKQAGLAMKADAAFDKTLKLDEKHWGARFMKATSLSFWPKITGKQAEALKHFEVLADQQELAKPQPHFAETYHFLGNMYMENGDHAKARATYERGLRWFPGNDNLERQMASLKKD